MLHMEILRSPLAHARIVSIDTSRAWQIPGVHLVLTGEMMATRNLAWMPTLSYDTQAVLATDKVRFQGQEVACVIADDPYIAKDACEAIDVEYEPLPAIVNPDQAVAEGAPVIRDDKENQADNVIYHWEVGDAGGTERAFAQADKISRLKLHYPRSHPSPIECCGSIADFNRATSKLTVYMTTQAPHIIRAAVALVAELPGHPFRVTERMFFQERMIQAAAHDLGMDQAEFRRINFVRDEAFPHRTPFGFLTDSGQYAKCLDVGLRAVGYQEFRRQQEEARAKGR